MIIAETVLISIGSQARPGPSRPRAKPGRAQAQARPSRRRAWARARRGGAPRMNRAWTAHEKVMRFWPMRAQAPQAAPSQATPNGLRGALAALRRRARSWDPIVIYSYSSNFLVPSETWKPRFYCNLQLFVTRSMQEPIEIYGYSIGFVSLEVCRNYDYSRDGRHFLLDSYP